MIAEERRHTYMDVLHESAADYDTTVCYGSVKSAERIPRLYQYSQ